MTSSAVSVKGVSKRFRLYHEKNQYLKSTVMRGRRAKYDEFWALQDISFEIESGTSFGIIGSNGSGKSTLLKCLAGILTPDKGSIAVRGRIAALLELGAGFHPEMSGRENIFLNGAILGMTQKELFQKMDSIIEFAGLEDFIDTPVKNYSSGMTVRLGFAIAINVDPEILIIDEVLAVGDSAFQLKCHEKIEEFKHDGRTIILVSHGLGDVAQLCKTVAWIEKGRLKAIGDGYDVVGEYLGEAHDATVRQTGEIGERWGTREVEITGVEFLGLDRKPLGSIRSGAPVTLRINFHAHQQIPEIVAGFRISHIHGTNIWGTNTKRRNVHVGPVNGAGSIDIEIPEFPLLTGTYDLTIALSDASEVHSFDHWEKGLRFDVSQGKIFDEGLVTFPAHFSHQQ
jgi:ABC-type polysaccharide/polyol phosphate transport system ATPase subunit